MVAQLTYNADPGVGFFGMKSQNFVEPTQIESRIAETAVLYGNGVEAGSNPDQVVKVSTAANFAGVAIFAHTQESSTQYDAGKSLPIMTKGRVWVQAGGAVSIGAELVPSTGATTLFSTGTATSLIKMVAITAAAGSGDLMEIELLGPQV